MTQGHKVNSHKIKINQLSNLIPMQLLHCHTTEQILHTVNNIEVTVNTCTCTNVFRKTERQTDRKNRQTDRQTERQTDKKQTDRQKDRHSVFLSFFLSFCLSVMGGMGLIKF